jgi:hypothetical protein
MVHELNNKRHWCEAHLLAQALDGFTATRQRQQMGIEDGGGG